MILGKDCYDIIHHFKFKKSEGKAATWAVRSKIGWALSGPLVQKQATTLATTATSITDDKLANQLSKWWDIGPYATKYDVSGHSKVEQRAIKTLERTTRFSGERYEVGLLWREDKMMLPNNFYSAMWQLKSLEQRLQKDEKLKSATKKSLKRTSTLVTSGKLTKPNETKPKTTFNGICYIILSLTPINLKNPEECATEQQSTKA